MGSKTKLPPLETVRKWTNKELLDWLKESQLSECIPTFQERNIDGATLLEMPNDKIITELSDVKIKQRMQVAKCVTECKSQAAEAKKQLTKCIAECKHQATGYKKVVSSLSRSRKKRAQVAEGSAGEPEDYDSSDGWATDEFETDDEDEDRTYRGHRSEDGISASDVTSDNVSTNGPESVASSDSSGQYNDVLPLDLRPTMPGRTGVWTVKANCNGRELDTATPEPSVVLIGVSPLQGDGGAPAVAPKPGRSPIPKPPSASPHQLGKLSCNMVNGGLTPVQRRSVPRLQRPPSQPPAPPPNSSPSKEKGEPETPVSVDEGDCWEYEIPTSGIPRQQGQQVMGMVRVLPAAPVQFQYRQQGTNGRTPAGWTPPPNGRTPDGTTPVPATDDDTYEPIDKPEEETYEAVDDSRRHSQPSEPDGSVPGAVPCLPPRKPVSLPPHLLVPPLPEKPLKMVASPPASQAQPEFTPPLPSKGLNPSKSVTQFVSKLIRNKQSGRRESNVSVKDVEAVNAQESNGPVTVTVNGSSSVPSPPPLPRMSAPSYSPSTRPPAQAPDESCSMTLRPLPPVPLPPVLPPVLPPPPAVTGGGVADDGEDSLDRQAYYYDVEREEAEQRLLAMGGDDVYLVRPSRRAGPDNPYTLTLVHKGKPFHLNIRLRPDGKYALGRRKESEMVFSSVFALVRHHQQHPIYLSAQKENVGTSLLKRHP